MPPRKSYIAAFKLEAVAYAQENGNRATGCYFSINEKMVRNWRKQEDELHLTKKSKRANCDQKARWPALEDKIETWVLEQRASLPGVSTTQIRLKAVTMIKEFSITDFTGGPSWFLRFMRRKQLSIRARTTVCQNLPADFEEKLSTFWKYCQDKVNDYSIHPDHVVNMGTPTVTVPDPTYSVNRGSAITLECSYSANPPATQVRWWKENVDLGDTAGNARYGGSTTSSASLIIYNAAESDEGTYVCKVTNTVGTGISTTTTLDVVGNGNRLKEIVSETNGDNQIGLSGENQKSAVDELKDNIDKEGPEVVLKHLNADLNNWRNEPVKLAVTGKSGVGKSSFINTIRNMEPGNYGFATTSSSGNTTEEATVYEYPGNPKITLHDLPGYGTIKLPTNGYEKTMKLYKYDYILIFVGNIEENDLEIAKKLKEFEKPFCFVRSKIDLDIQNAKNDNESEEDAVEKIISKSLDNLEYAGFNKAKFFVISNHNRKIYQFNDLVLYIQRNLPALKCDVVMFSLSGEFTDDIINEKYQLLIERLLKVSVASVGLNKGPISIMDSLLNIELIVQELLLYHKAFGFEQQIVTDILKVDYIKQKLSANSIIKILAAEAMREFVTIELANLRSLGTRGPQIRLIDSVAVMWPAGGMTFILLNQVLDSCRDDAQLVYSHIRNVDD